MMIVLGPINASNARRIPFKFRTAFSRDVIPENLKIHEKLVHFCSYKYEPCVEIAIACIRHSLQSIGGGLTLPLLHRRGEPIRRRPSFPFHRSP